MVPTRGRQLDSIRQGAGVHQWNRNKECLAAARNAPSELRFNHSVASKYWGIMGQACEREDKSASFPTPFKVECDSSDVCNGDLTRVLQGGFLWPGEDECER